MWKWLLVPSLAAVFAGFQTWRLDQAHSEMEVLRHRATQLHAQHLESSLKMEREFNARLQAQERATQRLVTQWRDDLKGEIDEAEGATICGPADVLSARTRERLWRLSTGAESADAGSSGTP